MLARAEVSVARISRRRFAGQALAALSVTGLGTLPAAADAQTSSSTAAPSSLRPDGLRSEFLMDLVLETTPGLPVGARSIIPVVGGTFEGPKLRGKVIGPGADWAVRLDDTTRVLDVRTLLVTDDEQRIYLTYRGLIYTPPAGQGDRYWRMVPIFETDSPKYAWLTHLVAVGVSFNIPQRVSYRIFQIL